MYDKITIEDIKAIMPKTSKTFKGSSPRVLYNARALCTYIRKTLGYELRTTVDWNKTTIEITRLK